MWQSVNVLQSASFVLKFIYFFQEASTEQHKMSTYLAPI